MRAAVLLVTATFVITGLAGCLSGDDGSAASDDDEVKRLQGQGLSTVAPGSYSVFPGAYRFDGSSSQPLTVGTLEQLPPEEVTLASDLDGVDIDLTVWRPDTDEPVPIIMQASPYYSDSANVAGVGRMTLDYFLPHGYAYVQLAIRSTGNSGGCDDFRGPKMTADMTQAIDWLVSQDWATESVGIIGISYVGTTPWYAAGSGNPHVKTIVPISGSTNAWEVYNRNGTPESRSPIIIPTYVATAWANADRTPEHKAENMACQDVYMANAYGVSSGVLGDRIGPEWWQERNAKPKVEANYEGSIFLIHGLEDWNVDPAVALPWADELNRSGLKVKHLLGQWPHSYPDSYCSNADSGNHFTCRWDYAEILLRWFDSELKGLDVDTGPRVQVQDNQGAWRDESNWPPHDAQWARYNLTADLTLAQKGEVGSNNFPLMAQGASAYEFTTGPLEQDLRISGLPRVHVTVTPTGPGGTVGARLLDLDPATGETTRIGWTAMNLKFRDGTETPQDVTPGQAVLAMMEIQPMDAVVPAGHELVLRLAIEAPSDRVVPPPGTPVEINVGPSIKSVLDVPVVHRGPEYFFEPPFPAEE